MTSKHREDEYISARNSMEISGKFGFLEVRFVFKFLREAKWLTSRMDIMPSELPNPIIERPLFFCLKMELWSLGTWKSFLSNTLKSETFQCIGDVSIP